MIPLVGKIYSTLGNSNSLVPLAIKDVANSLGLTAGSYITGDKLEGKDRFIDEFGTQAIWLFGIPTYKKIIDLTLYKLFKIDPKFDVRNLKNKEILQKSLECASTKEIEESIKNAIKNQKFTKGLAVSKFVAATLLTIASYAGLTKYRHKTTKKAAEKEILAEMHTGKSSSDKFLKQETITTFGNKKTPSFTGGLENFMFNPVKNLMILDGSITTERLANSRNKQEFIGYTIKEGTFWAFMYFASKPIQKFLEKRAEIKHNKSIDLDARVIESEELKNAFKNKIIPNSINEIKNLKSDVQIYEFINKNPDNFIVKIAKMSDIIPTIDEKFFGFTTKKSDKIDTRKFIDIDEFKAVAAKLEKLYNQFNSSSETLEGFLKQVKKLKRISVLKNMGACVGVLGIFAPALMVISRKFGKEQGFQVKEDIKKELAFNGQIA